MKILKNQFIVKEIRQQSSLFITKEQTKKNVSHIQIKEKKPLPKSFKEYAVFCYQTNNTKALLKGVCMLVSHLIYEHGKKILKCSCLRQTPQQKQGGNKIIQTRHSHIRPIWMQLSGINPQDLSSYGYQFDSMINKQTSGIGLPSDPQRQTSNTTDPGTLQNI